MSGEEPVAICPRCARANYPVARQCASCGLPFVRVLGGTDHGGRNGLGEGAQYLEGRGEGEGWPSGANIPRSRYIRADFYPEVPEIPRSVGGEATMGPTRGPGGGGTFPPVPTRFTPPESVGAYRAGAGNLLLVSSAAGVLVGLALPWYTVSVAPPTFGDRWMPVISLNGYRAGGYRFILVVVALGLLGLVVFRAADLVVARSIAFWRLLLAGSGLLVGVSLLGFVVRPVEIFREIGPGEMTNDIGLYLTLLASLTGLGGVLMAKSSE